MHLFMLALITMALFAANGLLCRLALTHTDMDAVSFTILRIVSGALILLALAVRRHGRRCCVGGSFKAATALFVYLLTFSLAYRGLTAATGTLIIVASILLTAIAASRFLQEPIGKHQFIGVAVTFGGLIILLTPAISKPSTFDAFLMGCAGAAWVVYSILGKKSADPALDMAGIFTRCLPFTLLLLPFVNEVPLEGALYATISGAIASGVGYILWYRLVTILSTLTAALVQLIMPILTALGGWLILGEDITPRLFVSGSIIIGGIAYAHLHSTRHS
jgi:drug/metabolite transporter (DMT)-like permease